MMLYMNNDDIAKQHYNNVREELERYKMAEHMRLLKRESAGLNGEAPIIAPKPSLFEQIIMLGRRML
ncbi:hypothetical protein [Paenibacillus caui]|uniref:hypothetical protein n=1 Tax=Paenibacillus caui TaxID=2873927 RepID=UPI001CAA299F|nr:hypothetical protein [Paenibacillus caui]